MPCLRAKEEGDLSAFSSKASISDGMGCISVYGMGSLHVLEGAMTAERYIKVLEQHMLPSRRRLFQGRPCEFQQDNAKPHTAAITTAWLCSRRVRVLNWPTCSPDISPIENIAAILNEKYVKDDHELFSSWKPISGRTKNSETHNLDVQTTLNCFEKKRRCYTMVNKLLLVFSDGF